MVGVKVGVKVVARRSRVTWEKKWIVQLIGCPVEQKEARFEDWRPHCLFV